MGFLSRVLSYVGIQKSEGEWHEGPYHLPVSGGWLPAGSAWNFWQLGKDVERGGSSAIVQACVSAYAQTAAMCPGSHWRVKPDGGRERVTNSALSRVLHRPNEYQTPSDFVLNLTSQLYRTGNAYALALRNNRNEIIELHLMSHGTPMVAMTGDVFYSLSGNEVIERQIGDAVALRGVPARDVLHVRLEAPRHPLLGETPLTAAMLDLAASNAMARQAISFFDKQARPSGTLNTDKDLSPEQVAILRERWNEQSRGLNAGGTPILTSGLKWEPMTASAKDTQFAEIMKMTEQNVALAFRVPLQILGIGGTPYASTESLMQSWIASGLGFCLNHIELAFDQLFRLSGSADETTAYTREYVELDTAILLRSNFSERMDGYAKAIIGGVMSPNEVAAEEGLPTRGEAGNEPRVQQQVVPLSFGAQQQPEPIEPANDTEDAPDEAEQGRQLAELFTRGVHDRLTRNA
jgi:HK97 family phage portal protein